MLIIDCILVGIFPVKWLLDRLTLLKTFKLGIFLETFPLRLFLLKSTDVRGEQFPIDHGISPLIWFPLASITDVSFRLNSSFGMPPDNLFMPTKRFVICASFELTRNPSCDEVVIQAQDFEDISWDGRRKFPSEVVVIELYYSGQWHIQKPSRDWSI